jgi:CBS domain-containing protein
MQIAQILKGKTGGVYAIAETADLSQAARELDQKRIGCVVVLDGDGALVGVLSERDIVRVIARRGPGALTDQAGAVMTRAVITASPDASVDDGLALMTDRRIRHLPVMRDGRLLGLVSIGDLVKHKIEQVEVEAAAMRAYIATG